MARPRVGQGFTAIMAVSFASAFVIPPRFTTMVRTPLAGVFAPVSMPVRWAVGAVAGRFRPVEPADAASSATPRAAADVYDENARLRGALATLQVKFDQLARVNADRQAVGDIRPLCRPATVTGFDASGVRDVLLIAGAGVPPRRPVVSGTELVGRTAAAGLTGADVQLVSDPKFAVTGRLGRYVTTDGVVRLQLVDHPPVLVQGVGDGKMAIRSTLTMTEVAGLGVGPGDVVVLDDADWPANVQGFTIGQVATKVLARRDAPLFADVRVTPMLALRKLDEVMVMVKD